MYKSHLSTLQFKSDRPALSEILADSLRSITARNFDLIPDQDLIIVIDALQELIDAQDPNWRLFERHLKRIVHKRGIFPSRLFLHGIRRVGENPAAGGAFGDVWKGEIAGRSVALKVLRIFDWSADQGKLFKEFCAEAMIWRQLNHPNVLPFYGICTDEFSPRYAMISPWMSNEDMMRYLKKNPTCDRLQLIYGVASGLCYLHSLQPQIIHGDLRGANVVIDEDGHPRLSDFGLSRVIDSQASLLSTNSQKGTTNVRWQSPELMNPTSFEEETGNVTTRSDIYALACVFLEIFTERIPFSNLRTEGAIVFEVASKGSRPLRPEQPALQLGLNDDMWSLMQSCWSLQPSDRPSAQMVLEQLEQLLEVQNVDKAVQAPHPETDFNQFTYEKIVRVLIETERDYVEALDRLQHHSGTTFLQTITDSVSLHSLSNCIADLSNYHRKLLGDFEGAAKLSVQGHHWAHYFKETASRSSLYELYCEQFTLIMNISSQRRNQDKSSDIMSSELFTLLLKPVYRLYVYHMLSESLMRLDQSGCCHNDLSTGHDFIKMAIVRMEKAQITKDLKWRVKDWKGIGHSRLRDLILDGLVIVHRKEVQWRYHAFLFRDVLLFCGNISTGNDKHLRSKRQYGERFLKRLAKMMKSPDNAGADSVSDRSLRLRGGIYVTNIISVSQSRDESEKMTRTMDIWWKRDPGAKEQPFSMIFRTERQCSHWKKELDALLVRESDSTKMPQNGSIFHNAMDSFVDTDNSETETSTMFEDAEIAYATDNNLIRDIRTSWASAELNAAYQAVGLDSISPKKKNAHYGPG